VKIRIGRNKIGLEDVLFGVGIVTQTRDGKDVDVTRINAANLPFDETRTLKELVNELLWQFRFIQEYADALLAIADNLTFLLGIQDIVDEIQALIDDNNLNIVTGEVGEAFVTRPDGNLDWSKFRYYARIITEDVDIPDAVNAVFVGNELTLTEGVDLNFGVDADLYILE